MKQLFIPIAHSFLAAILLVSAAGTAQANDNLNAEELKELLVGNFLKVNYIYSGKVIHMWEFYQEDGTITGSSEFGPYSASFKIVDDKVCPDYAEGFEAYEGCYGYQRKSGNDYRLIGVTWPENESTLDVTIVKGIQENLGN